MTIERRTKMCRLKCRQVENALNKGGKVEMSIMKYKNAVFCLPYIVCHCAFATLSVCFDSNTDPVLVDGVSWRYGKITEGSKTLGVAIKPASRIQVADVIVPSRLLDYNVLYVYAGDFDTTAESPAIQSVLIPEGVTEVDTSAFRYCSNLRSLSLPRSLSRIGSYAFQGCTSLTEVAFCSTNHLTLTSDAFRGCTGLTALQLTKKCALGNGAFNGCTNLIEVVIPPSVTKIGRSLGYDVCGGLQTIQLLDGFSAIPSEMFAGCTSVRSLKIPEGVESLESFSIGSCGTASPISLENVELPSTLTNIASAAFDACPALKTLTIPEGVRKIEHETFSSCTKLSSITLPSTLTEIDYWAFKDCVSLKVITIPSGIKTIHRNAFAGCTGVEEISIPVAVTSPSETFPDIITNKLTTLTLQEGWSKIPSLGSCWIAVLRTVNLPSTINEITSSAFSKCKNLTKINIPNGVTKIGTGAFSYCERLEELVLPEGVVEIGNSAFSGCKNLSTLEIPNTVRKIGGNAFSFSGLTHATIPDGVGRLEDYMTFGYCRDLMSVDIPNSVSNISNQSFEYCSSLQKIAFPSNLTSISSEVCRGCSNLTEVTIPPSVNEIRRYAFAECVRLERIFIPSTVSKIEYRAFFDCKNMNRIDVEYGESARVRELLSNSGLDLDIVQIVENEHDVVFDVGSHGTRIGGGELKQRIVDGAFAVEPQLLSDKGWRFCGWDQSLAEAIVSNVTLTAQWAAITYSVRYDANGGDSGAMEISDCVYDSAFNAPASAYSRTGYDFVGWALTADGEVAYYSGDQILNLSQEDGKTVELYAVWKIATLPAPQITPADGTVFGGRCRVKIDGPNNAAQVYYRVGASPKATDKFLYKGIFTVASTSTIYSFAKWGDATSATNHVTLTVGDASDLLESAVSNGISSLSFGGDGGWQIDQGCKIDGESSVKIGSVDDNQTEWIEAEVTGPGMILFSWRTSCEEDELQEFDHLEFKDGDEVLAKIDGILAWQTIERHLADGVHVLRWAYVKDESDANGDDCGWVDGIVWIPDHTEPIPDIGDNPTRQQVEEALDGSADAKLKAHITDGENYNAYREWADRIDPQAVKDSPNAWVSFALGSDKLLENAPTDEDLTVEAFEPSSEAGKFDFTVSVEGVEVGSEAQKENLKQVFGLEGAATLDPNAFSSGNVDLTFDTPKDGKVKFTAGPKDGEAKTFFMKVRVNP